MVISHLTRVTAYLQLNSPPFNPASIPSRQRLLNRQVKLLRNLVRFHKRCSKVGLELETARLIRLVIEEGLVRVAEGGWEVGGEPIVRRVSVALPPERVLICPVSFVVCRYITSRVKVAIIEVETRSSIKASLFFFSPDLCLMCDFLTGGVLP